MSEVAKAGDPVSINYTGKLEDGTVFDSSDGRDAFQFEAGSPEIIPGMNAAVIGMKVGEAKTVQISPDQAYGEFEQELVLRVAADKVPPDVKVGDALSDGTESGMNWLVTEMTGEEVVLDGNHPLAGKTLVFDIELVGIG